MAKAVIVMGVSGSGKSTVGRALAQRLRWAFVDGDDHMPAANVHKMASGIPLTDADRFPWLDSLGDLISAKLADGQSLVMACSALKKIYRDRLRTSNPGLIFVHLKGDYELIKSRLESRPGHFMKVGMLQGQFDILEEPKNALVVPITQKTDEIIDQIISHLSGSDQLPIPITNY